MHGVRNILKYNTPAIGKNYSGSLPLGPVFEVVYGNHIIIQPYPQPSPPVPCIGGETKHAAEWVGSGFD